MTTLGTLLATAALGYAVTAWLAVRLWRNSRGSTAAASSVRSRPVTVLKPLCGAEPGLDDCLRSFCKQDYAGAVQIIFGVQHSADPALTVLERLRGEFPSLELTVVVDPTRHGTSAKVSNLINMMRAARYDWLVLADSDVRVPPGYLAAVTSPLVDPHVGIVTCPYRGVPRSGLWSLLGALFIDEWFMPSVRVAALFGSRAFAFGATIALRRDALDAIGGFPAIANQLADDYRLGELTRRSGLRTVLSDVVVETWVDERSLRQLLQHGLRWLRTIRAVRPSGYALSAVTFSLPVAVLGCTLAGGTAITLWLLAGTVVMRILLHFASFPPTQGLGLAGPSKSHPEGGSHPKSGVPPEAPLERGGEPAPRPWASLWALPVSDALGFALWCWGFAAREVQWRQSRYRVARDGSVQPIS